MNHKSHVISRFAITGLLCAAFGLFAGPAKAAYQIGDDQSYLKIGGLLQNWITITENAPGESDSSIKAAPDGENVEAEFYLRRMRIILSGQLSKWFNFFVETDIPNFGKGGDLTPRMIIQDAYLEANLHPALQIDVGMILVPFSHQGYQAATTLLGVDYHTDMLMYPSGSNIVWRDFGVMLRGMPLGKWFEYRLGVFNGVHGKKPEEIKKPYDVNGDAVIAVGEEYKYKDSLDPRNAGDYPRLVARLVFNVFEPEGGPGLGGFFNDGIYLEKKPEGMVSTKRVLAIGGSIDWQKDVNAYNEALPSAADLNTASQTGTLYVRKIDHADDYVAANADVFWDIPLGEKKLMSLNGQIAYYYYNYGDRSDPLAFYNTSKDTKQYTGNGLMAELGFRYNIFQPLFLFDYFQSDGAYVPDTADPTTGAVNEDLGDFLGLYGGVNFWVLAHALSFKVQFGGKQYNGNDFFALDGRLQAQLVF